MDLPGRFVPLLFLLCACSSAHRSGGAPPGQRPDGATVLTRSELNRRSGDLLSALASGLPQIRVERRSATSACPVLTLRGDRTILGERNPLVYVDGTEMNDTCILAQLRVDDVERVEIYPGGISARPGTRAHAAGLILVFRIGGG